MLAHAFDLAYAGDPVAAFGGIVALNREVDSETAEAIVSGKRFLEVVIAPAYAPAALDMLKDRWKDCRILATGPLNSPRVPTPPSARSHDRSTTAPSPAASSSNNPIPPASIRPPAPSPASATDGSRMGRTRLHLAGHQARQIQRRGPRQGGQPVAPPATAPCPAGNCPRTRQKRPRRKPTRQLRGFDAFPDAPNSSSTPASPPSSIPRQQSTGNHRPLQPPQHYPGRHRQPPLRTLRSKPTIGVAGLQWCRRLSRWSTAGQRAEPWRQQRGRSRRRIPPPAVPHAGIDHALWLTPYMQSHTRPPIEPVSLETYADFGDGHQSGTPGVLASRVATQSLSQFPGRQ